MTTKARLHELVEQLPDPELEPARRFLEYLRDVGDPMLRLLMSAPVDDEPSTADEDQAAQEAWDEYRRGEARPWAEVRRELRGG
jgi:hypothetical protein